jgi:hypothetical protein
METMTTPVSEDELQQALAVGRQRRRLQQRAAEVRYDPAEDVIDIDLADGVVVRVPRMLLAEFRLATPADMAGLRVSPMGYAIKLDALDISVSVAGLLAAVVAPTAGVARLRKVRATA